MPHIVQTVTAVNTTFSIAFCFLSAKDEGMFDLAIKAFKEKLHQLKPS
jgi:hypothetical protein